MTDHDTTGAWDEVRAAARMRRADICVPGIEITAVARRPGRPHARVISSPRYPELVTFLEQQRDGPQAARHEIGDRLARLGVPVDPESAHASGQMRGRALGRPVVAAALVRAGTSPTFRGGVRSVSR